MNSSLVAPGHALSQYGGGIAKGKRVVWIRENEGFDTVGIWVGGVGMSEFGNEGSCHGVREAFARGCCVRRGGKTGMMMTKERKWKWWSKPSKECEYVSCLWRELSSWWEKKDGCWDIRTPVWGWDKNTVPIIADII
jgi:hypothetical protein